MPDLETKPFVVAAPPVQSLTFKTPTQQEIDAIASMLSQNGTLKSRLRNACLRSPSRLCSRQGAKRGTADINRSTSKKSRKKRKSWAKSGKTVDVTTRSYVKEQNKRKEKKERKKEKKERQK